MKKFFSFVAAMLFAGSMMADVVTVYDWAGEIGTTVLGASGVEVSTVKIHTNTDAVPAIKFGSSYVYADGKWIAIKPAEGGFQAGDVLSVAAVFNNADDTKYAQVDLRAANGDTRIWMSDSASTINGRTQAGEPIVQTYTLEADQDSLFLGRYGNTGMFITLINVVREAGDVPPTPEVTYTVAGMASVFGSNWNQEDANNDMIKQEDGTYKWEKAGIELAAGNVEFKVVEDHSWDVAYPAQNYNLAIEEDGIYTITITFNAETKEIAAVATKTGDAEIDPVVSIAGSMNGWSASANVMTLAEDKATASLALSLDVNTYEFKVVLNGGEWRSNAQEFTRENASAADMTGNLDNMHLVADVAGEYLFTWTFADNSLAITYPEAPVVPDVIIDIESEVVYDDQVEAQGWWQFMAGNDEYSITISNLSATQAAGVYTIADLDTDYTYIKIKATDETIFFTDGSLTLTEGEDGSRTIEGIIIGDDGNIYSIKLVFHIPTAETTVNVEIAEWEVEYYDVSGYIISGEAADGTSVQFSIPGGSLFGTFTYEDCFAGGATGIEVNDDWKYIYSLNVTVAAGGTPGAERAFVTADILCYNNTLYHVTTLVGEGIDAIEAAEQAVKAIVNGQVVVKKGGKTYNMNGAVIR